MFVVVKVVVVVVVVVVASGALSLSVFAWLCVSVCGRGRTAVETTNHHSLKSNNGALLNEGNDEGADEGS